MGASELELWGRARQGASVTASDLRVGMQGAGGPVLRSERNEGPPIQSPHHLLHRAQRAQQLEDWTRAMEPPPVVWLPGLFNPMAFLTAVLQTTARQQGWVLDRTLLVTEVSMPSCADALRIPFPVTIGSRGMPTATGPARRPEWCMAPLCPGLLEQSLDSPMTRTGVPPPIRPARFHAGHTSCV